MEERKLIVSGHGYSALRTMAALMDVIPTEYHWPMMPMPKVKERKPVTVIGCAKCGRVNVTLKKTGDNEYKCLKCSREGVYLIE